LNFFYRDGNNYEFLFAKNDPVHRGLSHIFKFIDTKESDSVTPDDKGMVSYTLNTGTWDLNGSDINLINPEKKEESGCITDNNG